MNPTNPNDRPTPHEVELTGRFRDDPNLTALDGVRKDEDRTMFYVAHPIRVTDGQCLTCHSTPDMAPPAMVAAYGRSNGFGWHLNDTVGMVELSVPITEELRGTTELAATLAGGLFVVCLVIYLALTSALGVTLVAPLRRLASAAEAASLAGDEAADLPQVGTLELRRLSRGYHPSRHESAEGVASAVGRADRAVNRGQERQNGAALMRRLSTIAILVAVCALLWWYQDLAVTYQLFGGALAVPLDMVAYLTTAALGVVVASELLSSWV